MTASARQRDGLAWLLLGAMAGSLVAARFETAGACLAVAALAGWAAGAPRPSRRWLSIVATGAMVAWTLNLFLIRGHALVGPSSGAWALLRGATREGLELGALVVLRLAGAAAALHGLRAAWPGERAADELADRLRGTERLGVPIRRIRAVIALALRFVPVIRQEAARISAIQRLRAGAVPRGLVARAARVRAVVVPTLVGSLERAGQVALALEARHYRLREPERLPRAGWGWRGAGWAVAGLGLLWR